MSNRAWMPLHITDYLADTGHLNAAEHGAYLMLIMHYWQNGSLPADERLLARLARMSKAEWAESRDVLAMLFGSDWTHKRIDAELTKADEIIEKRRAAANVRYAKSKPDANAEHVDSKSTDTGALPRTLDQAVKEEPNGSSKKRGHRLPDDFICDVVFAMSVGLTRSQAENEAVKFHEWWPAQPGQKGVKLDWGLTWQTWCRKAVERLPAARGSPKPPSMSEAFGDFTQYVETRNASEPRDDFEGPQRSIQHLSIVSTG